MFCEMIIYLLSERSKGKLYRDNIKSAKCGIKYAARNGKEHVILEVNELVRDDVVEYLRKRGFYVSPSDCHRYCVRVCWGIEKDEKEKKNENNTR